MRKRLIISQILVLLLALGIRLLGFGWVLIILVLTPYGWACAAVIITVLMTAAVLSTAQGPVRWRRCTWWLLALADAGLLVFAWCAADTGNIYDSASEQLVPLALLLTGDNHVSGTEQAIYATTATVSIVLFAVAAVAALVVAVAGRRR
ncbi:hypothetical protein H0264_33585 [Nocardia huaxiensis]|uniref:Uncharacterized protein n=1 Tax=Nocardia huaxiensis TaxID=2755382 RepID=A0A7D6ZL31_9NOCA|nr:hypothetical protein [Nocardia huaxiensis]QLY30063.1 hypothetical protein H0264_33585 [Nocardia huaxiensis]